MPDAPLPPGRPVAPGAVPNPAAARPGVRSSEPADVEPADEMPLSRPARGALKAAEWLPDWAGSIRFR
ncbi:MAG TPA: hypothetical protein VNQ33_00230, partial [Acidimicrobiales bacterium]|nr:hypothetical protein [Acidimicrobiales bacterium]